MSDQTVTVLATRWENMILLREPTCELDLLIDFGAHPPSVDRVCRMLESLGTSASRIDAILVTHLHTDHYDGAGLAAFLDRREDPARPLPFYLHAEESLVAPLDARLELRRFQECPFMLSGRRGKVEVIPVRMSHSGGCCGFRIGDDYVGGDGPTREVFEGRVMGLLGAFEGRGVLRMHIDVEALSVEAILRADIPEARKRTMLDSHGIVTDVVEAIARDDLRAFFARLERLVPLHVTAEVNDPSGVAAAKLIRDARDAQGFTFEVPIMPIGFQELSKPAGAESGRAARGPSVPET